MARTPRNLHPLLAEAIAEWIDNIIPCILDREDKVLAVAEARTLVNYTALLGIKSEDISDAFDQLCDFDPEDGTTGW